MSTACHPFIWHLWEKHGLIFSITPTQYLKAAIQLPFTFSSLGWTHQHPQCPLVGQVRVDRGHFSAMNLEKIISFTPWLKFSLIFSRKLLNIHTEQTLSNICAAYSHSPLRDSKHLLVSLRNFTPPGDCLAYMDLLFSSLCHHPTSSQLISLSGWRTITKDKAMTQSNTTRHCPKTKVKTPEIRRTFSRLQIKNLEIEKSWLWLWILLPSELSKLWFLLLPINPLSFLRTKRLMELKKTNYLICIFNEAQMLHKCDMSFNSI